MPALQSVAIAHTPFKQKFGVPRQAGLVPVEASIELLSPFNQPEAVEGLEACSHLWLIFQFDQNPATLSVRVRPPRLGGNARLGVFATRSSFRPNGLGLTLVKLQQVIVGSAGGNQGVSLQVSGIDLVDQTPIVDIKPYVPYADHVPDAVNGIAPSQPEKKLQVIWCEVAAAALKQSVEQSRYSEAQLVAWITDLVALDPRPAYKSGDDQKIYHMQFDRFDVHWQVCVDRAVIQRLILVI